MLKQSMLVLTAAAMFHAAPVLAKPLPKPVSLPSVSLNGSSLPTIGAFSQTIDLTTSSDYSPLQGTITISGFTSAFSNLSFQILSETVHAATSGTSLASTFSDNLSPLNLAANTTYHVLVSGMSTIGSAQYNVNATGGFSNGIAHAAAVPEPGTYTLLLAGLGLVGLVVRRRTPGY